MRSSKVCRAWVGVVACQVSGSQWTEGTIPPWLDGRPSAGGSGAATTSQAAAPVGARLAVGLAVVVSPAGRWPRSRTFG